MTRLTIITALALSLSAAAFASSEGAESELKKLCLSPADPTRGPAPKFDEVDAAEIEEMYELARQGNESVQRHLMTRAYWGHLHVRPPSDQLHEWTLIKGHESEPLVANFLFHTFGRHLYLHHPNLKEVLDDAVEHVDTLELSYNADENHHLFALALIWYRIYDNFLEYDLRSHLFKKSGFAEAYEYKLSKGIELILNLSNKQYPKGSAGDKVTARQNDFLALLAEMEECYQLSKAAGLHRAPYYLAQCYQCALNHYDHFTLDNERTNRIASLYLESAMTGYAPAQLELGKILFFVEPMKCKETLKNIPLPNKDRLDNWDDLMIEATNWLARAGIQGIDLGWILNHNHMIQFSRPFTNHVNTAALHIGLMGSQHERNARWYTELQKHFKHNKSVAISINKPQKSAHPSADHPLAKLMMFCDKQRFTLDCDGTNQLIPGFMVGCFCDFDNFMKKLAATWDALQTKPVVIQSYSYQDPESKMEVNRRLVSAITGKPYCVSQMIKGQYYLTVGTMMVEKVDGIERFLDEAKSLYTDNPPLYNKFLAIALYRQAQMINTLNLMDENDLINASTDLVFPIETMGQAKHFLELMAESTTHAITAANARIDGIRWGLDGKEPDEKLKIKLQLLNDSIPLLQELQKTYSNMRDWYNSVFTEMNDLLKNSAPRNYVAQYSPYYKVLVEYVKQEKRK